MKRLFTVNGEHFDQKENAKKARGEPTAKAEGNKPAQYKHQVHRGPDHIGNHGWNASTSAHRAPQALQPKRETPRVRNIAKK